ncbi:hypothetical protein E2C01_097858 [Portunus trituberculatus]|uniref:Uncharacterized protein n=1 Tax=Portunus trituberculatus TaxID=210409 RepID=A0A5B7K1G1_PORTR|nr:hypothetical protein [Portunus trituberculatus]
MTDFLKPNITAEETVTALTKYIGFFKTLRSRGFRLAYHEPNYLSPTFTTVAGIAFSILAEQLWINTLFHPPPRSHHRHHLHHNTRAYKAIETVGEFM